MSYYGAKISDRSLDIDYRVREMDAMIREFNVMWGRGLSNHVWVAAFNNWEDGMFLWTFYESQRGLYRKRTMVVIQELEPRAPADQSSASPAWEWGENKTVPADTLAILVEKEMAAGRSGSQSRVRFIRTQVQEPKIDPAWTSGTAFAPEIAEDNVRLIGEAWWITTGWVTLNIGIDPRDVAEAHVSVFHQSGQQMMTPEMMRSMGRGAPDIPQVVASDYNEKPEKKEP